MKNVPKEFNPFEDESPPLTKKQLQQLAIMLKGGPTIIIMNEHLDVLNKLARRTNPSLAWWCSGEWASDKITYLVTCHICNKRIIDEAENSVYLHGMQHLKECNLLPFL